MTDADRRLLVDKCGEILHRALTEIRSLTWSWEDGNQKRIEDLSDITHNLPRFMTGRDEYALAGLRECFVDYARRYWPDADPARTVYVSILDMDEATFADLYRRTTWDWPEPEPVPAAG